MSSQNENTSQEENQVLESLDKQDKNPETVGESCPEPDQVF